MHKESSLKHLAFVGILWSYLGSGSKLIIQVGIQVVLARLLGPHNYGVFAISVLILSLLMYFTDICSSALIPRKVIAQEQVDFAFTWQLLTGLIIAICLNLFAGAIAGLFHEEELIGVLRTLSLLCIVNGYSGVLLAVLRRSNDFKTIQLGQVVGYFIGYVVVGLTYALYIESNAIALAYAWLTQLVVTTIIYYKRLKIKLTICFDCKDRGQLLKFGFHSLISNLSTWGIYNLDKIIIGKFYSSTIMGYYNTAYNLLATPLTQVFGTLQQLIFSLSPKINGDVTSKTLSLLIASVIYILSPFFIFIVLNSELIINVLYGSKWKDAASYLSVFGVTTFFYSLGAVITPVIWSQGHVKHDALIQLTIMLLIGVGCIQLIHSNAIFVAYWVASVYILRTILLVAYSAMKYGYNFKYYVNKVLYCILFMSALTIALIITKEVHDSLISYLILNILIFLTFYVSAFIFRAKLSSNLNILVNFGISKFKARI